MDNDLEVPVIYKNQELFFIAKFIQYGYSYKFNIEVNGIPFFFEPDEERNFRVIIDPAAGIANPTIDRELIQLIIDSLTEMLKQE